MIVERLNVAVLAAQNEGQVGCDECGHRDAVWGVRLDFLADLSDEPYSVALCEEHFQTLARKTGGRLVAPATPAKADDLADALLAPVAVESTEGH